MKNLFVALMAVCALVSCGGDSKSTASTSVRAAIENIENPSDSLSSSSVRATIENIENPGDYLLAVVAIQDKCSDRVDKAKNADEIISAVEELAANMVKIQSKVSGLNVSSTNMDLYESEGQKYAASTERLRVTLNEKGSRVKFTPQQEERFIQVLQNMYNSVPQ